MFLNHYTPSTLLSVDPAGLSASECLQPWVSRQQPWRIISGKVVRPLDAAQGVGHHRCLPSHLRPAEVQHGRDQPSRIVLQQLWVLPICPRRPVRVGERSAPGSMRG